MSQKVLSPPCVPPAEQRLRRLGLLHTAPQDQPFFRLSPAPGPVEDDHVPFLQRGDVPNFPLSPGARCPLGCVVPLSLGCTIPVSLRCVEQGGQLGSPMG